MDASTLAVASPGNDRTSNVVEPRPKKRPRTDVKEENTVVPLRQCHDKLWYEDGNLVILAGSVLFRVHRGLISSNSPVLKASILMPSPEAIDGCPVLKMDDHADDVAYMLYSVYDATYPTTDPDFEVVSAWLRLGTKYQFGNLRQKAIDHLESWCPQSLVANDAGEFTLNDLPDDYHMSYLIAQLAFMYNLTQLLPVALYDCGKQDIDVFQQMASKSAATYGRGITFAPSEIWEKHFFRGRSELVTLRGNTLFAFLGGTVGSPCKTTSVCTRVKMKMLQVAYEEEWIMGNAEALEDISEDFLDVHGKDACAGCLSFWKEMHQWARQQIWNDLPSTFGLEISDEQWVRVKAKHPAA